MLKNNLTLDNLANASFEELNNIPDIGPILAKSITEFFKNEDNMKVIEDLKNVNVNMTYLGKKTNESSFLNGKRIVVTGTLENYTRDQIQEIIEENGGLWSSSVTKKTSAVLVGTNPGSKYDKAKELNIPIWSEQDFQKMLEEA